MIEAHELVVEATSPSCAAAVTHQPRDADEAVREGIT